MMNTKRIIVFDGNDGSGKKTQSDMLADCLRRIGKTVLLLSFPQYEISFFGNVLKSALAGEYGNFVEMDPHIASIPYATDRQSTRGVIAKTIRSGGFVICDRWTSANQIHQGGKIADEVKRAEFLSWLDQMEHKELRVPQPGVSIYLDVPLEVSLKLMGEKNCDTVENNRNYLENSHKAAQWLMTHRPEQWIRIRCASPEGVMRTREDIHEEVVKKLVSRSVI